MQLTFKTISQARFAVDVPEDATVAQIKERVESSQGSAFQASSLRIIHKGRVLTDDATVASVGLTAGDTLVVMASKQKNSQQPQQPQQPSATETSQPSQPQAPHAQSSPQQQQQQQPSVSVEEPSSNLVSGEQLEGTMQQMVEMGFEREQVQKALKAAYNNPNRAVEYLMNGIPEGAGEQQQPAAAGEAAPQQIPQQQQQQAAAASQQGQQQQEQPGQTAQQQGGPNAQPFNLFGGGGGGGGSGAGQGQGYGSQGSGALDALRNNPQFEMLRAMVQQNPNMLQSLMNQLAQSNPQLMQMIQQNQSEFLSMMQEPISEETRQQLGQAGRMAGAGDGDEGGEGQGEEYPAAQLQPTQIEITQEENEAINRLVELGFDRQRALEAYLICDKNENLAANYLFSYQDQED